MLCSVRCVCTVYVSLNEWASTRKKRWHAIYVRDSGSMATMFISFPKYQNMKWQKMCVYCRSVSICKSIFCSRIHADTYTIHTCTIVRYGVKHTCNVYSRHWWSTTWILRLQLSRECVLFTSEEKKTSRVHRENATRATKLCVGKCSTLDSFKLNIFSMVFIYLSNHRRIVIRVE